MLEEVDGLGHQLYYPLYCAIIVCYSRPFTDNKPHGSLAKKWYTFENEFLQKTHKKVLKARHELIAHSDMTVKEAMIVPPGVEMAKAEEKPIVSDLLGFKQPCIIILDRYLRIYINFVITRENE